MRWEGFVTEGSAYYLRLIRHSARYGLEIYFFDLPQTN